MHRLLRTSQAETTGMGYMTWAAFLQLMTEIGFNYDPSAAGSGTVRFDSPNSTDESITFHRRTHIRSPQTSLTSDSSSPRPVPYAPHAEGVCEEIEEELRVDRGRLPRC
ncbi:hypothetical protein C8R46DRAFT_1053204 [Mycena filopes]|nr:hypothetical protein C8R46DRAFT_1053204 [Mycena filopes]